MCESYLLENTWDVDGWLRSTVNGQRVNQSYLCNQVIKLRSRGLKQLLGWWLYKDLRKNVMTEKGLPRLCTIPIPWPMHLLFHLIVSFPEFCEHSNKLTLSSRRCPGNLWIIASWSKTQKIIWVWDGYLKSEEHGNL